MALHSASSKPYSGQNRHSLTQSFHDNFDGAPRYILEQTDLRPTSTTLSLWVSNVSLAACLGSDSSSSCDWYGLPMLLLWACNVSFAVYLGSDSSSSCDWYGLPMLWFGKSIPAKRTNSNCNKI